MLHSLGGEHRAKPLPCMGANNGALGGTGNEDA